jgi:Ca2+-binding EF-hand superfamily protein
MSSISALGSSGGNWPAVQRPQRPSKEALLQRVDTDASGGVDASELQEMLARGPGGGTSSTDSSAGVDFSSLDGDSSGSLDATELDAAMKALSPKPSSTMEFAQQRGSAGDDLFSKVDSNGDGSLDSDELQALQDKMGVEDEDAFSRLDSDDSGSLSAEEFDAGRPQGGQQAQGTQAGQGAGGPGGMPPPPPGGGRHGGDGDTGSTDATSSSSSTTTYDPLDTNQDGVVSAQERTAGELKELVQGLLKAADGDGDSALDSSELTSLKDAMSQALSSAASGTAASGASSSSSSSGSDQGGSLDEQAAKLVDWMLKQYAGAGAGAGFAATGTQVNVSA